MLNMPVKTDSMRKQYLQQVSSGQEEPSRSKIRQNWDFFQSVLFGTGQSNKKTTWSYDTDVHIMRVVYLAVMHERG